MFIIAISCNTYYCYALGGFYAGIGAGYSDITNIPQSEFTFGNNGTTGNQNSGSITSTVYGGYNFNSVVGVQLDYNVAFNAQTPAYSLAGQLFDATVLLHLPFGIMADSLNGFSLYAKGGLGYSMYTFNNQLACATCVNPPSNTSALIPVYGAGAEYNFGNNLGLRAEWDYSGSVTAANLGNNQVELNSNTYLLSILYYF